MLSSSKNNTSRLILKFLHRAQGTARSSRQLTSTTTTLHSSLAVSLCGRTSCQVTTEAFTNHSFHKSDDYYNIRRSFTTVGDAMTMFTSNNNGAITAGGGTAKDAKEISRYNKIDFTIQENKPVYEAVKKFSQHHISCLVVTNDAGQMTGILSERDYICKIAALDDNNDNTEKNTDKTMLVKDIATHGKHIVTASMEESIQSCLEKMLSKGIRHLPLIDDHHNILSVDEDHHCDKKENIQYNNVVGLISIQDLAKIVIQEKEYTIQVLSDLALGQGCHFGSD